MSQSYVIRVSASVREKVTAKDRRTKSLVLTEIVPAAEQKELLKERLAARGWVEKEGKLERRRGEVVETIDLADLSVEATVELERTLERERTITVRGDRDREDVDERREKERGALERAIAITDAEREEAQARMQRRIAEVLDQTEEARTTELNEVVREVYAESLKRKAARLGSVTAISERQEGGEYELVIKVTE